MRAASSRDRIALSAIAIDFGRHQRGEPLAHAEILVEGAEIARVHPDDLRADAQRAFELGLVVGLDEHREPEPDARARARSARTTSSGIAATISSIASAPIARVSNTWISSMTKSLRSTGSSHASAGTVEVVDRAAEVRAVGEHREARRAAGRIRLRR